MINEPDDTANRPQPPDSSQPNAIKGLLLDIVKGATIAVGIGIFFGCRAVTKRIFTRDDTDE